MGTEAVGNLPTVVEGPWPGRLTAVTLDTASTFDDLVRANAADDEQVDRILGNRFYRNIAGALSGTQEYMAGEQLLELLESGEHDIVVVDTPPSTRALDFLDASRRLTRFLDHRLYRALTAPARGYAQAISLATRGFLRTAGRVVGRELVDDAIAFFTAFEGMDAGFRERAMRVRAALDDPRTAYVLVTSPRADAVAAARDLDERLDRVGFALDAVVVNRVEPSFGDPAPARLAATRHEGTDLGRLWANLAELAEIGAAQEVALRRLPAAPTVRVPQLDRDVTDLEALEVLADHLTGSTGPDGGRGPS
jgi:anion-transporting  ArsA/GET3 family ATPase